MDEIRQELKEKGDADYILKPFQIMRTLAKEQLEAGNNIILDATHPTAEIRKSVLKDIDPNNKYEKIAYYLNVPYEVCNQRGIKKGYANDDSLLKLVADKLEKPTLEEMFDKIVELNYQKDMVEVNGRDK